MDDFIEVTMSLLSSPLILIVLIVMMVWSALVLGKFLQPKNQCHVVTEHQGYFIGRLHCSTHNFHTDSYTDMQDHMIKEISKP